MKHLLLFCSVLLLFSSCAEKKDAHALLRMAKEKTAADDFTGAQKDILESLQADSTFDSAYFLMGSIKQQMAENEEAISYYNKAIKYNPAYAEAYNNRALCNAVVGNSEGEKSDLDKALELNPKNQHAWYNRGNYWLDRNQYSKAVDDYSK